MTDVYIYAYFVEELILGLVVVVLVASELVSLLLLGEMLAKVLVEYLNDGRHLLVVQRSRSHEVNTLHVFLSRKIRHFGRIEVEV